MEILHIFNDQKKFSQDFFCFLRNNNFDLSKHYLFHYGRDDGFYKNFPIRYCFGGSFFSFWGGLKLLPLLLRSKKIVVHSLASPFLLFYLFIFPSLAKKVYWVIWGKDLYFFKTQKRVNLLHKVYEFFRCNVIKNIRYIVTGNPGDYTLARLWYKTDARMIDCFVYPSNLFKSIDAPPRSDNSINILVGNSADLSNNHEEVFYKLKLYRDRDIKIYCPLSYGGAGHARKISKLGTDLFGNKFVPLLEFMPYEDYLGFLVQMDIAIFNHKRQQAFGNKITLLGAGKKVYMSKESTLWDYFNGKGIKVFDVKSFDMNILSVEDAKSNRKRIENYFSASNLDTCLKSWLK